MLNFSVFAFLHFGSHVHQIVDVGCSFVFIDAPQSDRVIDSKRDERGKLLKGYLCHFVQRFGDDLFTFVADILEELFASVIFFEDSPHFHLEECAKDSERQCSFFLFVFKLNLDEPVEFAMDDLAEFLELFTVISFVLCRVVQQSLRGKRLLLIKLHQFMI